MSRFTNLFFRKKLDERMEDEFRFHLDRLTEKHMKVGLSAADARLAARREFGSVESAKDRYRDQRGLPFLDDFWSDLRFAARLLLRNRVFSLVCVITLALGIGANAAIFSLVNAALLKLAPYPDASRLVEIWRKTSGQPIGGPYHNSQKYLYIKERARLLENVAAQKAAGDSTLIRNGVAHQVKGFRVSANYFETLGVTSLFGRSFSQDEDRPDGASVVILSHSLWQKRLAADPEILGKSINLGGKIYSVIGVMREDFIAVPKADFWIPLQVRPMNDGTNTYIFARLKPGVPMKQANAEIDAIVRAYGSEHRSTSEMRPDEGADLSPFDSYGGRVARTPLMILFASVGLVLLISCANLANLLLARASARTREVAIRATLGAGRTRIVRQLLAESLLIALLGGVFGIAVAYGLLPALAALNPVTLSGFREVQIDQPVLLFTGLLSIGTGILFGLFPALQLARTNLGESAREGVLKSSAGKGAGRFRQFIVISEVALSMVLLIGAGLLIRTFWNLLAIHPGLDVSQVLAGRMPLQGDRYATGAKAARFFDEGLNRIRQIPNVEAAAVILNPPMERGMNLVAWTPSGRNPETGKYTDWRYSTAEAFRVLRIPLLAGRVFSDADGADAAGVAVINQRFARLYFEGENPIGHTIHFGKADRIRTIIGVIGDTKSERFRANAPPIVYVPVAQAPDEQVRMAHGWFQPSWIVRSRDSGSNLIPALEKEVASVDPLQPFSAFRTLEEVRSKSLQAERSMMILLSAFATLAVFLAAAGIYGVISHTVAQRTHEIGIRMALGATATTIMSAIVRRGVLLAAIGVVIGLASALGLTRFLEALVFGIKPEDPLTFATGAGFLLLLAALASALPARRATSLDPAKALRVE